MKQKRVVHGFTLLELMTVVTIIGILAAIAVPNFLNAAIRAKVARSQSEIETLVWALEMYFVDQDIYPLNLKPGVSQEGDLSRLTTPIAYMGSIPRDIFLSPTHFEERDFIQEHREGNPYYFYVNFLQVNGNRALLRPYGLEGSANYVVYGMGPSFNVGTDPMTPEKFLIYNPSNGTSSTGVISMFAP